MRLRYGWTMSIRVLYDQGTLCMIYDTALFYDLSSLRGVSCDGFHFVCKDAKVESAIKGSVMGSWEDKAERGISTRCVVQSREKLALVRRCCC
jgi:hypothetical protein